MRKTISFLLLLFFISMNQQAHAQKKIVILGSSTAAGGGATSMDSAWAGRLQNYFRKNTADADTSIINLAVGGYVTYRIMPDNFVTPPNRPAVDPNVNVTKALTYNPDIIIVSMPSNDIASGYTEQEIMNNFRQLNQVITSQGVRAYFTTSQPRNDIDLLHRTQLRELLDSMNNNFGNRSINFYDDLVTQDGQYMLRDDRRTDNIHPNNTGHRLLFERVVAANIFSGAPPATPLVIPGKIEAESFSAMSGIQTETTSDAGGGLNVGWQDNNDWMDYNVNVSASGTYSVRFRVASLFTGAQFQLRKSDGTILSTVTVPNTGGFQNWQTVTVSASLVAGAQTLRIITTQANGGWNLNWMDFVQSTTNQPPVVSAGSPQTITLPTNSVTLNGSASDPDGYIVSYLWTQVSGPSAANISNATSASATMSNLVQGSYTFRLQATDNGNASANSDVTVTVNPATPPSSNIRIEAENYSAMSGIQTEPTSDAGGGLNVGWQDNNDWMDYSVNVSSSGVYTVNFRVASMFSGAQFQLRKSDGTTLATITVPNTGNFQSWQTVSASVNLPAGLQTLRITTILANGGWNINWWEIAGATTPPPTTSIKIEAENYSAMSGIQTEPTSDAGGGLNVGWQDNNDWMDYNVNLPSAGTYTANFRVASMFTGAQFQLRNSSGSVLATITVPNTGSFQNWQTVSATLTLPAGVQTLRMYTIAANGGWNINWWSLSTSASSPPPGNIRIEAENFSAMSGIQTEPTSDTGGGLNVGWQDNNDWMDYSVNVNAAGTYNINFRVASMFTGAQFQLRNSSGNVLATVTVPNTGSFQSWQTITVSATLPAGTQTLRIITTQANGGWNINWWEIVGAGTNAYITKTGIKEMTDNKVTQPVVFPNPFRDFVWVNINTPLQGKVNIELVDLSGRIVKQETLVKTQAQSIMEKVSFPNLKHGMYVLRVTMDHWKKSTPVNKE